MNSTCLAHAKMTHRSEESGDLMYGQERGSPVEGNCSFFGKSDGTVGVSNFEALLVVGRLKWLGCNVILAEHENENK